MSWLELIVLALVQGITEFLPISSSAHLVLARALMNTGSEDTTAQLIMDAALHGGTLVAVLLYCRSDVATLLRGVGDVVRARWSAPDGRLLLLLILATLPILPAGLLAADAADQLRTAGVIAATTIGFGLLLWIADRRAVPTTAAAPRPLIASPMAALAIGVAQCVALIPGTSRAGIVVTAAMLLGSSRTEAARIALLLGIPTIALASLFAAAGAVSQQDATLGMNALIGAAIAAVTAYVAIAGLMRLAAKLNYQPFVWYRLALGGLLIVLILGEVLPA